MQRKNEKKQPIQKRWSPRKVFRENIFEQAVYAREFVTQEADLPCL